MSSGVRKPSLENKFLGSRGLSKGVSGPEVSGGLGARAGLGPSGAFLPLPRCRSSWGSQSPCS